MLASMTATLDVAPADVPESPSSDQAAEVFAPEPAPDDDLMREAEDEPSPEPEPDDDSSEEPSVDSDAEAESEEEDEFAKLAREMKELQSALAGGAE